MTSSLVGSEMCIRDRPTGTLDKNTRKHPCSDHHTKTEQETTPQINGEQAVSYTHLTLPTICSV
eukprot:10625616-Prorocentrum_lima.AAC.1